MSRAGSIVACGVLLSNAPAAQTARRTADAKPDAEIHRVWVRACPLQHPLDGSPRCPRGASYSRAARPPSN